MVKDQHLVILDPTAFPGGSKIATENLLQLLDPNRVRVSVLSADKSSWQQAGVKRYALYQPRWLAQKEQGIAYFLRHFVIALQLFILRLRTGTITTVLGASGPGVDLALYLLKPLLRYRLIQTIHGPVACSRTIGRCLLQADRVFYLASSLPTLKAALATVNEPLATKPSLPEQFQRFHNGLPKANWPSPAQGDQARVFWAASLLKWKGLDLLLEALAQIPVDARPETHICYIPPRDIALPVTQAPVAMKRVHWHEQPPALDRLRANASIFVSTSQAEPFGLSILEALAAGLCVVIPSDGAYWDEVLRDGVNCIKYPPQDAEALAQTLRILSQDFARVKAIGQRGAELATEYRAETCYRTLQLEIEGGHTETSAESGATL